MRSWCAVIPGGGIEQEQTEELAVGHYFKRLTAFEYEFGTESAHLARYTALAKAPS